MLLSTPTTTSALSAGRTTLIHLDHMNDHRGYAKLLSTWSRQLKLGGDRLGYAGLVVVLGIVEDQAAAGPLPQRRIFETVDGSARIYAMPLMRVNESQLELIKVN